MISCRTPGDLRKLNFWETSVPRVLESCPEWRDFPSAWGLGADGETGAEVGNLAARGGESARGPTRGERARVPEGVGVQKSPKADTQITLIRVGFNSDTQTDKNRGTSFSLR